ncbi:hypothetical protein LEP3755_08520 [Leptolyngbya sp. NIES-3755]|nr:hypothetical protein LEP3755_08520 [Leptolyngbya sp. NIES-3755]
MNRFEDFMNEAQKSSDQRVTAFPIMLADVQTSLASTIRGIIAPTALNDVEKHKFSQEVSSLVQDTTLISEFSSQIGTPKETETEEEFVKRSSDVLRNMLYEKFGIK